MSLLDKAAILAAADLPFEDVEVKAWGGTVRVRTLTGLQRAEWELGVAEKRKADPDAFRREFQSDFVSWCLVDESGARLFATGSDVEALAAKSGGVIEFLYDRANALNRVTEAAVEDLAKNSSPDPSAERSSA